MFPEIQPGKYVMRNGKYAEVCKRVTVRGSDAWQGNVLSHFSHRGGMQNVWDEVGRDAAGLSQYDLVAPAMIDATQNIN